MELKGENMKIVENGKVVEKVENKCKVCGLGEIEYDFAICDYCGWEADGVQNDEPDYIGGANDMSLNQYKQFWEENKEDLLKHKKDLPYYAFEKAREYYEKNFKQKNEEYIKKHFKKN